MGAEVKVDYFAQKAPDADDTTLARMIREGAVPPGCLWGGELVRFTREALGEDPCGRCDCPDRRKCGGRPRVTLSRPESDRPEGEGVQVSANAAAAARKLERAGFIREVLALAPAED